MRCRDAMGVYQMDLETPSESMLWTWESAFFPTGESLTQQHQAEATDINVLVSRFGLDHVVEMGSIPNPAEIDFSEDVFDFQTAQNALVSAQRSFDMLPAKVRNRFQNNPAEFLAFCEDRENLDEMRKLGLAVDPPVPQTPTEPVVPEPAK